MIEPSIDKLMNKVDSKYTMVVLTAKRAREIVDQDFTTVKYKSSKPVTIALHEIDDKEISYERIDTGIK